mmetsp:Transcript_11864/g.21680  ORF Transcript_11864/g.21680 Transcript_11864/m.21680 type:complete len:516 (+) Transcript_11864:42-1589(+)
MKLRRVRGTLQLGLAFSWLLGSALGLPAATVRSSESASWLGLTLGQSLLQNEPEESHGHSAGHATEHKEEPAAGHGHGGHHGVEAAGHGGHGEADHGHGGHHHPVPTHEATALSLMLMGSVAFIMNIFYLVNWNDPDIRLGSWKVLSMTVSIFSSVLLYASAKTVVLHFLPAYLAIPVQLGLYFSLYCILQVALYAIKGRSERLVIATGTIFAHIVAFSAMYVGAEIQLLQSPWGVKGSNAILVALGTAGLLYGLSLVSDRIRTHFAEMDGTVDEAEELWMEQVEDAENDIIALAVGFLTMQAVRFYLCGESVPFHAHDQPPEKVTQTQINELFVAAVFFGVLTCVIAMLQEVLPAAQHAGEQTRRLFHLATNVSSMAMAWCLLFWGDWQLFELGLDVRNRVSGCILLGLVLTMLSLLAIFVLDFLADNGRMGKKALRSLILALGVLVGFSWEKAFDVAMEDIAHSNFGLGIPPSVKVLGQTAILCVVVIPAWYKYILPHAIEDMHPVKEDADKP